MHVEFESIMNTESIRYIYNTEYYNDAPVHRHFHYAQRRSADNWSTPMPLPIYLVGDYIASLAQAMSTNDELTRYAGYTFTNVPSDESISFAASVVYKQGRNKDKKPKPRYYSMDLQRISAVSSKKWDRRFEEITESMDGSPDHIMNLLMRRYSRDGITRYAYINAIRAWFDKSATKKQRRDFYVEMPAKFVGWTESYDEIHAIQYAWDAVLEMINIYRAKLDFDNKMQSYKQHAMITKLES